MRRNSSSIADHLVLADAAILGEDLQKRTTPSVSVGPGNTALTVTPVPGNAFGDAARDRELRRLGHAVLHHLRRDVQPRLRSR